jgi:Cytochrome C oxidase subunit II, periplasmic domain
MLMIKRRVATLVGGVLALTSIGGGQVNGQDHEAQFAAIVQECESRRPSPPADAFQSIRETQAAVECISNGIAKLIDMKCNGLNGDKATPNQVEICSQAKMLKELNGASRKLLDTNPPAPDLTVLVTGQQYNWRYTYRLPSNGLAIDTTDAKCTHEGPLVVPQGQRVRLDVTSKDVIHKWQISSLNVSTTGIPGRLNTVDLDTSKPGIYTGGTSATSGKDHAKMAITVHILEPAAFAAWKRDVLARQGCL